MWPEVVKLTQWIYHIPWLMTELCVQEASSVNVHVWIMQAVKVPLGWCNLMTNIAPIETFSSSCIEIHCIHEFYHGLDGLFLHMVRVYVLYARNRDFELAIHTCLFYQVCQGLAATIISLKGKRLASAYMPHPMSMGSASMRWHYHGFQQCCCHAWFSFDAPHNAAKVEAYNEADPEEMRHFCQLSAIPW